ncbi:MAG: hypothetical protein AAGF87_12855 [Bacteroidota bacterium]
MDRLKRFDFKNYVLHFVANFLVFGLIFGIAHITRGGAVEEFWSEALFYGLGMGLLMPLIPVLFGKKADD